MQQASLNPRPINLKALRRWIEEDGMNPATWTAEECEEYAAHHHVRGLDAFRQSNYQAWDMYLTASHGARATIDAVFKAVVNVASPLLGMDVDKNGVLGCSFTWHDGAQYRVQLLSNGQLARLFRYELTGGWAMDVDLGELVPDSTWRTVRSFSKDRAGKVMAPALRDLPALPSWTEASIR